MTTLRRRTYELLNGPRAGDFWSTACAAGLMILIAANVLAVILESEAFLAARYATEFWWFEHVSAGVFAVEYALRFWSAPEDDRQPAVTASGRRYGYVTSFNGVIDLVAILPTLLPLLFSGLDLRALRTLRLLRVLKFSAYSTALEDLFAAIRQERRAFVAASYLLLLALLLSSSLLYLAEHAAQPERFGSIPDAMWWSVITLTTVGYGDATPVTPIGKVLGGLTALLGVCTVALLTGIVASAFSNQLERRKVIYRAEVESAMSDGRIVPDERAMLERLRQELDLTEDQVRQIETRLSEPASTQR